ncbi:MAG: L-aspartate oxidase [Synechococcales bacterium]|nr:L-aspartate oxidase [Synechococcales bacterium]
MDGSWNFDVLVVGAGAAGLYSALCLPSHLRVGLISKDKLSRSASDWAQGGIAAVVDPEDSSALHIADTLKAGAGLCDYDAVQFLVEEAPHCIQSLVDLGVAFDREGVNLALTLEAAHSRRRVLHAADTTGRAVVSTLTHHVLGRDNIQVLSPALVLDVWLEQGQCQGVKLLYQQQIFWLAAGAVVLATGGGGQVFAQTTNPSVSTGDGVAIAHRAGAVLRDLEFVQFHPTALTQPGAPRFLISEAVRGEGAHLIDKTGRRFAFDYHPAGELAPRDVVSRAIFRHLQATEADPTSANVWLDLRSIAPEKVQHRFPNIIQVCQQYGINVFQDPIPVAPAAHYWMGGVVTDLRDRTSVPYLYAVGETSSTGVHGANRLASNSLLECIVFGAQLAEIELNPQVSQGSDRSAASHPTPCSPDAEPETQLRLKPPKLLNAAGIRGEVEPEATLRLQPNAPEEPRWLLPEELTWITLLRQELPKLVWQSAGICREQASLTTAIAQVEAWLTQFQELALTELVSHYLTTDHLPHPPVVWHLPDTDAEQAIRQWSELRNLLTIAQLILKSAHYRTESRGGHYCIDSPEPIATWQVHTVIQGCHWQTAPVISAPEAAGSEAES